MAKILNRRDFLKVAGLTAGAAVLAACAPAAAPAEATKEPAEAPSSGKEVTLEFWTFQDYATGVPLDIYKGWIAEFEKANPGLKVNITGKPGSDILANVLTAASSGDLPDAIQIQLGVGGDLISIDALVDMAPWFNLMPEEYQTQFAPGAMDPCKQNGKVYGLPFSAFAAILFRNLKVLKAAGIDPAAGIKTRDEFKTQLEMVVKSGKKGTGKILGSDWIQNHFYPGITGTTKAIIAPDGKSTQLAADAAAKNFDYLASLKPYCVGSFQYDVATADLFKTDQLGFITMGPWLAPDLDASKDKTGLEYDVIQIPGDTADWKGAIRGGEFTGITSPKNGEAAWKWVSFISDYPQEAQWAATIGRLMANLKALEQPEVKKNALVQTTGAAFATGMDEALFMQKTNGGWGQPQVDAGSKVDGGAKGSEVAQPMIDAMNELLSA